MSCGLGCVYYRDRARLDICKFCSDGEVDRSSRFELGKVDVFKLAEGLRAKEEQKRRASIPQLSDCPYCEEHSLFYNSINDTFECLNLKCFRHKYAIKPGTEEYKGVGGV